MTGKDQAIRLDEVASGRQELPFRVDLRGSRPLVCEAVYRHLPGRRMVCAALHGGDRVLAKLFFGTKGERDARRERKAALALAEAGIATPRLLGFEREASTGWPVLLYEFIHSTTTLADAWSGSDELRRSRLMAQLLVMQARLHEAGLRQRDPHLDNFLLDADERLIAIDAGGYAVQGGALGRSASVDNLGLLLAQFPRPVLRQQAPALEAYAGARGWEPAGFLSALERRAGRWRRWRALKLGRKSLRNCTEFLVREKGGLRIHQRRELDPERLDRWIEAGGLAPEASEALLKDGNSQTVWSGRLEGRGVVVKRYNPRGLLQILRRTLGGSRAARAWRNAHWLRACHIPTPVPWAMIEERRHGLLVRSWLITEQAPGQPAQRVIGEGVGESRLLPLVEVVRAFADLGLVHGDMKASNFILGDQGVQVIDLDSLRWPRWRWLRRRGVRADRERFLRNWTPALARRFRALLSGGGHRVS